MSGKKSRELTRRGFLQTSVAAAAVASTVSRVAPASAAVPAGPPLKAGLVGCGGRGTGAAKDILSSAPDIKITALADVFKDRMENARGALKDKGQEIRDDQCFVGVDAYKRIADGAIGKIVAARCYWNQGQLWYRERDKSWSDMEWMIRDWVNWSWLSGDHIVEQHVHNLDVINWFTGGHPAKAVGMGGRMRRVTGDQYDFFSIDFELGDGTHVHSMA